MKASLPDLSPWFVRYTDLARETDALFERIRAQFPDLVVCGEGCSGCCHALFDLTLVEALHLNSRFLERFPEGTERFALQNAAEAIDRSIAKIKRKAFKDSKAGKDNNVILAELAAVSVRCPLLGNDDRCILYEYRPLTCRLYGVPTAVGGVARTCGKTGFRTGTPYPTVALDKIQGRLEALSEELATGIGSAYTKLATMYVPVSTALITTYDVAYLGIGGIRRQED